MYFKFSYSPTHNFLILTQPNILFFSLSPGQPSFSFDFHWCVERYFPPSQFVLGLTPGPPSITTRYSGEKTPASLPPCGQSHQRCVLPPKSAVFCGDVALKLGVFRSLLFTDFIWCFAFERQRVKIDFTLPKNYITAFHASPNWRCWIFYNFPQVYFTSNGNGIFIFWSTWVDSSS